MQKYQLLLLVTISSVTLQAQEFYESFRFSETLACPFQIGNTVEWPEGWSVYHTKDNLWNGEVDSTWCISVELVVQGFSRHMYINAEEIDGERPVFIRTREVDGLPLHLPADMLFTLSATAFLEDFNSLVIGTGNPPTSGLIVSIDIPAEDSIQRDRRTHFYEFSDSTGSAVETCLASEKFTDQSLEEIILAVAIHHSKTKGHLIELDNIYLSSLYWFDVLGQHIVEEEWWVDTSYVVPIAALGTAPYYYDNYLLPYTSLEYPSSEHISYYDLIPATPSDTAQTISVFVEEYMSLVPQPFTALRGGILFGSDSIRHRVELVNNGGNLCINIVELTFEESTKYIHHGGTIDMNSDLSCMMFKSGATLEIGREEYLDYGNPGKGFLAMKQGSNLVLHDHASLTLQNTLVMQLSPTTNHTHPTVHLYPGSKLTFSPDATLEAWGSTDLRLRVMMLGGTIDVDALSKEERSLIEYIYPPASNTEAQSLLIHQDHHDGSITLYLNSEEAGHGRVFISDLMGHVIYDSQCEIFPGSYYFNIDVADFPEGWYCATLQTEERQLSAGFIHHLRD